MSMVVGVFESLVNAQDAVADLVASGYSRNAISLLVRNEELSPERGGEGEHPVEQRTTTAMSIARSSLRPLTEALPDEPQADAERALAATLEKTGLNPGAAHSFAEAICNGAVLVAVHCAPPRAPDARDILDVYNDSGGPPIAQRRSLM